MEFDIEPLSLLLGALLTSLKQIIENLGKWALEYIDYRFDWIKKFDRTKVLLSEWENIFNVITHLRNQYNCQWVHIAVYHNGNKDSRGIGFKNFSVRFEDAREMRFSTQALQQTKPLEPYFKEIKKFRSLSPLIYRKDDPITADNKFTMSQVRNQGLQEMWVFPIFVEGYHFKFLELKGLFGCLTLAFDRDSTTPGEHDTLAVERLTQLQQILSRKEVSEHILVMNG